MTLPLNDSKQKVLCGDCREVMKTMEPNSIDCIVTDPPYGLSFMGKGWDHQVPGVDFWQEAIRVLKPGGMMLAFGGTRTYHRMTCAIEDAGFEIRDCLMWIYGSGFPKSHNISKAIDKEHGEERQVVGERITGRAHSRSDRLNAGLGFEVGMMKIPVTIPTTDLAKEFDSYGTALKPAHEPIMLCQKPYEIIVLFGIILLELTKEVYKCQKSNYFAKDAEENLNDSLLLLNKVHPYIVPEHVIIYAWEKLSDVDFVIKNVMSLNQELAERINREKEFFVHTNAKENGNLENIREKKILAGEAECIFAAIQDIVTFVKTENIKQNIVLLWKIILIGLFQGLNKFTTKMVINLITELRILKSYLHQNISNDTGSLNPKYEPIIMAMKPLDGTYAENAEKWGVAGINVDESRIQFSSDSEMKKHAEEWDRNWKTSPIHKFDKEIGNHPGIKREIGSGPQPQKGRWPANVLFDEEGSQMLGEPSRFFYCAKASSKERNAGCEGLPLVEGGCKNSSGRSICSNGGRDDPYKKVMVRNNHPTVKPLKLMEYLIKMLMPPKDGVLLDPFAGSGSTLVAAKNLDVNAIGIELSEDYVKIIEKRLQ